MTDIDKLFSDALKKDKDMILPEAAASDAAGEAAAPVEVKVNEVFEKQVQKLKDLGNQLQELAAGRLESDIPFSDDYWKIKHELTSENHKLDNLR